MTSSFDACFLLNVRRRLNALVGGRKLNTNAFGRPGPGFGLRSRRSWQGLRRRRLETLLLRGLQERGEAALLRAAQADLPAIQQALRRQGL